MKNKSADLTEGPLLGKLIVYTIPIILTGVLQLLFNAADLVVVGRYCGSVSVAAVGACGAVINLLVNLFIGLSVGAGVTVAHGIGAGKDEDAFGGIVEVTEPAAGELDLFKAKQGGDTKNELRIVEIEFLETL